MSKSQVTQVLYTAIKSLITAGVKICFISISFILKTCGVVFTKVSEAIDRIILKNS
jgi:hypothetical protein